MAQRHTKRTTLRPAQSSGYVYGNTVRKLAPAERPQKRPTALPGKRQAGQRTHRRTNVGYTICLMLAVAVMGTTLVYYITLQSEISSTIQRIAELEQTLNVITQANDEAKDRVDASVNLEEIRQVAIRDYGMRYANEGQIVTYSGAAGNDYVRQTAEIPSAGN